MTPPFPQGNPAGSVGASEYCREQPENPLNRLSGSGPTGPLPLIPPMALGRLPLLRTADFRTRSDCRIHTFMILSRSNDFVNAYFWFLRNVARALWDSLAASPEAQNSPRP